MSDSPYGGFKYCGIALEGRSGWDRDSIHNPAVIKHNGKYYMYYMGNCGNGEFWDHRNHQRIGVAVANDPLGSFEKSGKPIMVNPEHEWAVEDAFIWYENGKFYSLAKDFQGYFTKAGKKQVALFCSDDGFDWRLDEMPLAFTRELVFKDGRKVPLCNMERPQLYIEDGRSRALLCACMLDEISEQTFNVSIPIVK